MTLTSTQTELVPTVRTSAVTSLSAAQQDRGCTSLTSSSEADRSHPAPHALFVELKASSVLLTNERAIDTSEVGLGNIFPLISDAADSNAATSNTPAVAFRLRHDAPEFVPPLLEATASCPDAPEIAPSEADLLPALDSGREKLLSSTESEDALKVLGEPETTVHAVDDTVSADPK